MENSRPSLFKLDYNSPEFLKSPFRYYRIMQARYPLYFHAPTNAYLLTRYEDVALALKDPLFSTACNDDLFGHMFRKTLIQLEGQEHIVFRNMISTPLRGKDLMQHTIPVIIKQVQALMEGLLGRKQFNFVSDFAARLPIAVMTAILGVDPKDLSFIQQCYKTIVRNLGNFAGNPAIKAEGSRMVIALCNYMYPLIRQYRLQPGPGLISLLSSAEIHGIKMTDQDIIDAIGSLISAGIETVDRTLRSLFRNLIAHPDQLALVRHNRHLVSHAIAETLRLNAPAQIMLRQPIEDYYIAGGMIPAHARVLCIIGAANRDSRKFSHPDTFDINRPDLDVNKAFIGSANHVAFGTGRHFCVGAMLAKAEISIAANILLDHFSDLRFLDNKIPAETGFSTRTVLRMNLETTEPPTTLLPYTFDPALLEP
ncbi:cytochrome P450 [Chitinophaga nivalis]|uniref:Cytochrome P450 n=1 Tax=Chitinophaga nivalis TaxID=2991709 RepID=A0ABT3IPC2_9BACT|nr:cytochrome P450 [Chitinophaga nivalis]MCW3464488.1 cytochrome P450 [Chitinophaga nivalis]MCW3485821.1 cytochrome P450 [Chitinophaga nivalis]